ncbi:MAG: DUF47 family protein [Desulfovibrionaceae bacterium]|nr:DUF47 family protein [Desulfovibrionaceae bacterium]
MFNSLLPKGAPFFELLLQQNQILCTVASEFAVLIEHLDNQEEQRSKILALEDEADQLYLTITRHLSQSFLTPIDREDILHINKAQEEAIDLFNNLSTKLSILGFRQARLPMLQLAKTVHKMTMLTRSMLVGLSEKRDSHNTRDFRALRNECEVLLSSGIAELYELGEFAPGSVLEIIKWSRTYDRVEKLIVYLVELDEAVEEAVLKHV